ncbi:MAG: flagellar protein FlaG [Candidatus Thiodiazotropha sp. (ex Dulcina madagascariensis)]|nr:flagellar protein FlaG [Candidatus Thiodiazotropha sp. (ex Epidulcina cf. delphinae)]MCU7936389.1 flagellar protein FlaG [Candidatus Thiodiazotropha sp. (ex Dulcina madagascariensis)]
MTTDMTITLTTQAAKELGRESPRVENSQPVAPKQGVAKVLPIRQAHASGSTQAPQDTQSTASVLKEDVEAAVEQMKDFAQVMSRQLQFDVDDESGRTVVRVLDKDSGDVIRQIPSDEVLALARHMKELMEEESTNVAGKGMRDQPVGLLVETQA